MPETVIKLFQNLKEDGNYLCVAKIFGNENDVVDRLQDIFEEKKRQLILSQALPDDCNACIEAVCVSMCRRDVIVLIDACCVMRQILTVEDVRGCLCHEFDYSVERI